MQEQTSITVNRPAILTRPLPHSSGQQNLALFRIYVAYRSLLSVVLLIMLVSPNTRQLVGSMNPTLYLTVALGYLATSVPLVGSLSTRMHQNQKMLFLVFLVDIVAITLLADCSGGMTSGLPILLVITAAASAVLLTNRTVATLIAALSVIALLVDTIRLILYGVVDTNALFPAGLLGALIFGVSIMVQAIAGRLGKAEKLARDRASDLYNLQRLNEQIVQHMDTGILLVDPNGLVRVMNKAATGLLAPERPVAVEQGRPLSDYSAELADQFEHWKVAGTHRARPFSVMDEAPPIIAHFRELQSNARGEALVFVEDYTPVTQYALLRHFPGRHRQLIGLFGVIRILLDGRSHLFHRRTRLFQGTRLGRCPFGQVGCPGIDFRRARRNPRHRGFYRLNHFTHLIKHGIKRLTGTANFIMAHDLRADRQIPFTSLGGHQLQPLHRLDH